MTQPMKILFSRAFLLAWLVVSVIMYCAYTGKFAYLQLFIFSSAVSYPDKLSRILPLDSLFRLLWAFGGVTLFSVACLSLGLEIVRRFARKETAFTLGAGVTAFIVGEMVFSTIYLTMVSFGKLTPPITGGILFVGLIIGLPSLRSFAGPWRSIKLPEQFTSADRGIAYLAAGIFTLGILYSVTLLGYDSVVEYFSHAKIMAVSQRAVLFYYKDTFVVSSLHPSILFTALIQLFGDQSARLLSWMNGLAILIIISELGRILGLNLRARLWCMVFTITSIAFMDPLGDGKIELITTAPILAAVYWALEGLQTRSWKDFFLTGLLAGYAIISRPYNMILVSLFFILFGVGCLYAEVRQGHIRPRQFLLPIMSAFPPLLMLGAFHLCINWVLLGDPLAPLAYARQLDSSDWQWQFDPEKLLMYRLFYPLTVTFFNSPQSLGVISPLFVGLLPFLFVKDIRQNLGISFRIWWLAFTASVTVLVWIWTSFTVVEVRYVFFLWLLLFLPAGQLLEVVISRPVKFVTPIIRPTILILLAYMGARTIGIAVNTYTPVDDQGNAQCQEVALCTFLQLVNHQASPGDRILVLNAYRYYLRPDLFACSSRWDEYPILESLANQGSPDFWVEAYRQGYRYLTYEKHFVLNHARFGSLPDPDLTPSWLSVTLISNPRDTYEMIYRIDAAQPPFLPEKTCAQNASGIWDVVTK